MSSTFLLALSILDLDKHKLNIVLIPEEDP